MWPFRKKKGKDNLSDLPMPESRTWDTVLGDRLQDMMAENEDVFDSAVEAGATRILIYFEGVGTATVDLTRTEAGQVVWHPVCWLREDPDAGRRGTGLPITVRTVHRG